LSYGQSAPPATINASTINAVNNSIAPTNSGSWLKHPHSLWLMPIISIIIIASITYAISRFIKSGRDYISKKNITKTGNIDITDDDNCDKNNNSSPTVNSVRNLGRGFWDIIREGDYYPSLARFQFLLWTFAISFVFLSF
jgi:hypothetical protein